MSDAWKVRFAGGRVVTEPGGLPLVWLPRDGQVIARIPPARGNYWWLHATIGIRSPYLDDDRWRLPRNCLVRLVTAAVDRYGHVVVCRDMARLSRCTRACLEATGGECQCTCMGASHGEDSGAWFEREGDAVVADLGEVKRAAVLYGPRKDDSEPGIYRGELSGRRYCADRDGRRDWPVAARFMCTACMTSQAQVWDHCHVHGFVRAPLCGPCNTRHWGGWAPRHGRAAASANIDASYYSWCPWYDEARGRCSA